MRSEQRRRCWSGPADRYHQCISEGQKVTCKDRGTVQVLRHVSGSGDSDSDNRELDDNEECPLYRAIMVLGVLQLKAERTTY